MHCFKDVPTVLPEGCEIAGVLGREDPVDSLIVQKSALEGWRTLGELPEGSVVGTSSVRRAAQLKRRYSGLVFRDLVSRYASSGRTFSAHGPSYPSRYLQDSERQCVSLAPCSSPQMLTISME